MARICNLNASEDEAGRLSQVSGQLRLQSEALLGRRRNRECLCISAVFLVNNGGLNQCGIVRNERRPYTRHIFLNRESCVFSLNN